MGKQALKLGASTFAFFTRNPRGGSAKAVDEADVKKFLELWKAEGYGKIVAHAPYTLNACSDKPEVRRFAREAFWSPIMFCRTGICWSPGMRCAEGTGPSMPGCGSICMN